MGCTICEDLRGSGKKHCPKCGLIKATSDFHKNARTASGLSSWCKLCMLSMVSKYQRTPEGRKGNKRRRKTYNASPNGRKVNGEYSKWYNKEHREKKRASLIVWRAVRAKRLIPEPCEVCGRKKAEAHHEDYSKPLNVVWLCRIHHIATRGH